MPLSSLRFWRSKPAPPPAATAPRRTPRRAAAASAPRDPDTERARTRQRLLGAAVLLGLGVLIFGLLFETEPRSSDALSAAQLARRDAGPVLGAPLSGTATETEVVVDPAPAAAAEPASESAVEAAPAVAAAPSEAPAVASVETTPAPAPVPAPPPVSAAVPPPTPPAVPPVASPSASPPPVATPRTTPNDGARARALLEGRPVAPPPAAPPAAVVSGAAPATPGAAAAARYVVQVGAYSSDNALREARQRVERLGLKTYTQVVQTPQGARTRVRVGPFQDRAQAEAAAEKLRAARLPADLLTL